MTRLSMPTSKNRTSTISSIVKPSEERQAAERRIRPLSGWTGAMRGGFTVIS
jgi:hypothetical protein